MSERKFRRSKLELYCQILKLCINDNHTKSDLNHELVISFGPLNEYLKNLQKLGLVEVGKSDKKIQATLKGKEIVEKFDYLMKQIR